MVAWEATALPLGYTRVFCTICGGVVLAHPQRCWKFYPKSDTNPEVDFRSYCSIYIRGYCPNYNIKPPCGGFFVLADPGLEPSCELNKMDCCSDYVFVKNKLKKFGE